MLGCSGNFASCSLISMFSGLSSSQALNIQRLISNHFHHFFFDVSTKKTAHSSVPSSPSLPGVLRNNRGCINHGDHLLPYLHIYLKNFLSSSLSTFYSQWHTGPTAQQHTSILFPHNPKVSGVKLVVGGGISKRKEQPGKPITEAAPTSSFPNFTILLLPFVAVFASKLCAFDPFHLNINEECRHHERRHWTLLCRVWRKCVDQVVDEKSNGCCSRLQLLHQ